jgi:hypothetical protein
MLCAQLVRNGGGCHGQQRLDWHRFTRQLRSVIAVTAHTKLGDNANYSNIGTTISGPGGLNS